MFGLLFHSNSHIVFTKNYFDNLDLRVVEIRDPDSFDWPKNPFEQSNKTWIGTLFPMSPTLSLRDHKIIVVQDNKTKETRIFWRQVNSNYFFSGSIHFKESINLKSHELEKFTQTFVIVSNKCPACGSSVKAADKNCSECGISFH